MKNILIVMLAVVCFTTVDAQNHRQPNPFESIGKAPKKILTLSDGKYQEFFFNDTLRRVGSVMFNTMTGKIAYFIDKDSISSEDVDHSALVSRWLSQDPLARKFPSMSPYNFTSNNPILFIDPDGGENVIYLVSIPTGEGKIATKIDYKEVARLANNRFKQLGIKTRVVYFGEIGDFDGSYMDATDNIAYIGNPADLNKEVLIKERANASYYRGNFLDPLDYSTQDGIGITVSERAALRYKDKLGAESIEDAAAFGIVHGTAHNTKSGHMDNNPDYKASGNTNKMSYAMDGNIVGDMIAHDEATLDDFFDPAKQPLTIKAHENMFGNNPAKDNYQYNKTWATATNIKDMVNLGYTNENPLTVDQSLPVIMGSEKANY